MLVLQGRARVALSGKGGVARQGTTPERQHPQEGGGLWRRGGGALGEKDASMFSDKHSSSGKTWEQRSKQGSQAAANQQLLISLDNFLTIQQGRKGPQGVGWERDGGGGGELGYLTMITRFTNLRTR